MENIDPEISLEKRVQNQEKADKKTSIKNLPLHDSLNVSFSKTVQSDWEAIFQTLPNELEEVQEEDNQVVLNSACNAPDLINKRPTKPKTTVLSNQLPQTNYVKNDHAVNVIQQKQRIVKPKKQIAFGKIVRSTLNDAPIKIGSRSRPSSKVKPISIKGQSDIKEEKNDKSTEGLLQLIDSREQAYQLATKSGLDFVYKMNCSLMEQSGQTSTQNLENGIGLTKSEIMCLIKCFNFMQANSNGELEINDGINEYFKCSDCNCALCFTNAGYKWCCSCKMSLCEECLPNITCEIENHELQDYFPFEDQIYSLECKKNPTFQATYRENSVILPMKSISKLVEVIYQLTSLKMNKKEAGALRDTLIKRLKLSDRSPELRKLLSLGKSILNKNGIISWKNEDLVKFLKVIHINPAQFIIENVDGNNFLDISPIQFYETFLIRRSIPFQRLIYFQQILISLSTWHSFYGEKIPLLLKATSGEIKLVKTNTLNQNDKSIKKKSHRKKRFIARNDKKIINKQLNTQQNMKQEKLWRLDKMTLEHKENIELQEIEQHKQTFRRKLKYHIDNTVRNHAEDNQTAVENSSLTLMKEMYRIARSEDKGRDEIIELENIVEDLPEQVYPIKLKNSKADKKIKYRDMMLQISENIQLIQSQFENAEDHLSFGNNLHIKLKLNEIIQEQQHLCTLSFEELSIDNIQKLQTRLWEIKSKLEGHLNTVQSRGGSGTSSCVIRCDVGRMEHSDLEPGINTWTYHMPSPTKNKGTSDLPGPGQYETCTSHFNRYSKRRAPSIGTEKIQITNSIRHFMTKLVDERGNTGIPSKSSNRRNESKPTKKYNWRSSADKRRKDLLNIQPKTPSSLFDTTTLKGYSGYAEENKLRSADIDEITPKTDLPSYSDIRNFARYKKNFLQDNFLLESDEFEPQTDPPGYNDITLGKKANKSYRKNFQNSITKQNHKSVRSTDVRSKKSKNQVESLEREDLELWASRVSKAVLGNG